MVLSLPPFVVDLHTRRVRAEAPPRDGVPPRDEELTHTEARLLTWLAERPGRVLARGDILAAVWGFGPRVVSRTLDTTLSRLRAKIEVDPTHPRWLVSVPGEGLRLDLPAAPARPDPGTYGREREVAEVRAALGPGRVVTLTGPGGAGKTHLARALGRGATFCALDLCRDEADLVRAVGAELSPGWDPRPPSAATLAERVATLGPVFLVLDDVERAVTGAARVARALVDQAPEATILVTSREPLGIAGERVVALGGLDRDAAAALFAARAPTPIDASWSDPARVDALLAAVDRLPLAVELLAGWADQVPADTLADRVGLRIELLVSERRDIPERHRSLAGVVADSIRLLPAELAQALTELAVFDGAFDAAGAEAVVGRRPALVAVRGLVRRSLVHAEEAGRFRLFEAVRAVVRASGVAPEAGLRLAEHLARLGDDPAPLRLTEVRAASAADLRTALDAALAAGALPLAARVGRALAAVPGVDVDDTLTRLNALLSGAQGDGVRFDQARLLWASGRLTEARATLAPLLSALPAPEGPLLAARVRVLELAAAIARDAGDTDAAVEHLEAALAAMGPEAGIDPAVRGGVLADLGTVCARRGETTRAEAHLVEGLALLAGASDTGARAAATSNLAAVYRETGRDPLPLLHEALALHRAGGRRRSEGIVLGALGIALLDAGDAEGAHRTFGEAVETLSAVGARHVAAVFRANRAYVDRQQGRTALARQGYEAALHTLRAVGDSAYEALALGNLGEMAAEDGRVSEGMAQLEEAITRAGQARFSKLVGVWTGALGLWKVRVGEVALGHECLERAETILREGGYRDEVCRLCARRAEAAALLGDRAQAVRWLDEARALRRPVPWVDDAVRAAEEAVGRAGESR